MAMSVGGAGGEERPMSDINTTPLVDVMLVLLIIFLIAVPVAIQSIEKLKVPILVSEESQDKVENLMLSVVSTDAAGRSPKEPGYEGSSRTGQCRVYFNNITPVDNQELYQQAFNRLDAIVKREGGAANMDPEKIPEVHIRGDVNVPWKCIAGAIYNVQSAGYPKVGFISTPVDPG
ncbi:biopolymer transporter ExbD [Novosphingobium sp. THN1]|jgi:biopolymer transport protein ExbD|uniref:ExbD/TolR family protein n=1 Tax=unclassified Novosphingobium TaxID=2644732 RepID=UPI000E554E9E|nr:MULTISPECIES: biopolymer transporter ExbD [unclassified Novosphingobium]MBA4086652.1 biopolymer transporter ExbD [Novosphingobium sp.]MBW9605835.1 biopolymer transporter ExbD [Staphylococcus aureus]TXH16256.1 MAG: biopolymer transporter ExbD [Gammaproteobacteria bacterium]AXU18702.1 biopolymer transporter ExbD [Novosphingobium sp. THN1]NLR39601.1 biopolymer transporter ExbD [Novosphingobium sp. ERW19]